MLEVQQKALQSGLKFLAAAGAKFAVIDADGAKHGELEVASPPLHPRSRACCRWASGLSA